MSKTGSTIKVVCYGKQQIKLPVPSGGLRGMLTGLQPGAPNI